MSIVASDFKTALLRVGTKFSTGNEMRMPNYGALQAVLGDTSMLLPASEIERAKNSYRQDVELAVLSKYTATDVDVDDCTITGEGSSSAVITPTYSGYGFTVAAYPESHYGNQIGKEEKLAFDMFMGWKKVFNRLDVASVALLEASKHALTGETSKYFNIGSSTAQYTGDLQRIYGYMPAFLKKLNLSGPYKEVANTEALTPQLLSQAYGVYNNENKAALNGRLPGSDNFSTFVTNNVSVGDNLDVRYVFEPGTFGMLNWNRPMAVNGAQITEADTWGVIQDPFFGFTWTVHYQKRCTDLSGTYEGMVASIGEHWLIKSDFSFLEAYSSDTTQGCVKFTTSEV